MPHQIVGQVGIKIKTSTQFCRIKDAVAPPSQTFLNRKTNQGKLCIILKEIYGRFRISLKAVFLFSQGPLAASQQVLASSQNNFLSSDEYYNLMNIGLAGLSNRDS